VIDDIIQRYGVDVRIVKLYRRYHNTHVGLGHFACGGLKVFFERPSRLRETAENQMKSTINTQKQRIYIRDLMPVAHTDV